MGRGSNPGNTGGGAGGDKAADIKPGDIRESCTGESCPDLGRVIVKGGRRNWREPADLS